MIKIYELHHTKFAVICNSFMIKTRTYLMQWWSNLILFCNISLILNFEDILLNFKILIFKFMFGKVHLWRPSWFLDTLTPLSQNFYGKNFFCLSCHKILEPIPPLNFGHHKWTTSFLNQEKNSYLTFLCNSHHN